MRDKLEKVKSLLEIHLSEIICSFWPTSAGCISREFLEEWASEPRSVLYPRLVGRPKRSKEVVVRVQMSFKKTYMLYLYKFHSSMYCTARIPILLGFTICQPITFCTWSGSEKGIPVCLESRAHILAPFPLQNNLL